jgi:hypothetical protein
MSQSRVGYACVVVAATGLVACGDVTFVDAPADGGHGAVPFSGSLVVDAGDAGDADATKRPLSSDAAAGACAPVPVPSFAPLWKPPAMAPACAGEDANLVIDCLLNSVVSPSADTAACLSHVENECRSCLITPEASPALGPIIALADGTYRLNFAGCVAIVSQDTAPTSCGARTQANDECVYASCTSCKSLADSHDCIETAQSTVCALYHDACLEDPSVATTIALTCGPERQDLATFATKAKQYADLFCGTQ